MRIYYSIDQEGARAYFLGNFDSYTDATKAARQLINERQQSSISLFIPENHLFYRDKSLRVGTRMRLVRRLAPSVQQNDRQCNPSFSFLNIEICIHESGSFNHEEKQDKVA